MDELGYCSSCRVRYEQRHRVAALLGDRARRSYAWLFAGLSEQQATALAAHVIGAAAELAEAGSAQIRRQAIGWAIGELFAEWRETGLRAELAGCCQGHSPRVRRPALDKAWGSRR